ncbi:MAG: S46 family peptidase, partial [Bacteroidaceae bacterium]|nr:S46 family peptidase [Bacteroidaceae bacterium]
KKQAFEEKFKEWCLKNNREEYGSLLSNFDLNYKALEQFQLANTYISEAGRRIELITFANRFLPLAQVNKDTKKEEIDKRVAALKTAAASFYKDYYQPIDREVAATLLKEYLAAQPADFRPDFLNGISDVDKYVEQLFQSMLVNEEAVNALLNNFKPEDAAKLNADPALVAAQSLNEFARKVNTELSAIQQSNSQLMRIYMKAQMEMQPEKRFSPDANSTLRVTYGKVEGFQPKDGVFYRHFTTLDGVMQKENPDIYDYVVEPRLKELYEKKDYGRYADKDGSMHVCFTASVHTTGGNSGSPILNAEGQLLGLNFDRCWEGTMSDLIYDPAICRNISVDIRYVLFIIDKFAGAGHLLDEMTIVQ